MNKINQILIFLSVFIFLNQAHCKIVAAEQNQLNKSISEANFSDFKKVLNNIPNPFVGDSGASDRSELIGEELIDFATKQNSCRDEYVQLLVDKGARPAQLKGISLSNATKQLCSKTIETLTQFYDDSDLIGIGKTTIQNAKYVIISFSNNSSSEAQLKEALSSAKIFSSKSKLKCSNDDLKNGWCEIKSNITSLEEEVAKSVQKLEAESAAEKISNSPEGIKEQICELQEQLREAQAAIDEQKEIGKTSGVQNKEILYEKGSVVVKLKKDISNLKVTYKSKAKKNMGSCN